MLAEIKRQLDVPIATDLHAPEQAEPVAAVADLVQIPAFLVRQTDLIVAAAKATAANEGLMHVKKAQFLAPWDCKNIITKAREAAPDLEIVLCERGASFGYNNLVVDMLGIGQMRALGVPVSIDATHAVQLPGADPSHGRRLDRRSPRGRVDHRQGSGGGGRRRGVPGIPSGSRQGAVRWA
jgi:2-dehydro-3-deoxyphosphooctonate aldolase (KDO 8-P synthase)